MSGYPNQPNQHPMQPQQIIYQQQHQDQMMPAQQSNPSIQMNYGMGGMGQPSDSYMQGQHYSMGSAPSGMNPLVYNSISTLQARSPYGTGGMGGPHSIPQPSSVNPLSVPPQGPGSVPGQGPLSVPQQGPSSVQGPMSVPQQGPGSVPGQGPLSVPQPGSLLGGGPGSVGGVDANSMSGLTLPGGMHSNQGPSPSSLSIPSHLGPSPLVEAQGRSPMPCGSIGGPSPSGLPQGTSPSLVNPLSHGGPQSVSAFNPSTPHTAPPSTSQSNNKKDEESPFDGIFLTDPMQLSKQLISKDLRVSFSEMNKSMGELLKNKDCLTLEQNEKYTRDYNEFMAVCDQVEQALTMVMETSKMMSKLDRSYTPDGGNTAGRSNEYSIQPLLNYVDETNTMTSNVEKTVSGVFDIMSKMRRREALYTDNNGSDTEDLKMETEMGGKRASTAKAATKKKKPRLDSNMSEEIASDKDDDFDVSDLHGDTSDDEESRRENVFSLKRNRITGSEKVNILDESMGDIENITSSHYLPYSDDWSPQYLFRLSSDIVGQLIRESGGEGMGRNEMARRLRIDATTKGGNRRISANIQTVVKLYPHNIGQFQKMEGKVRTIRYFWKEATEPAKFTSLYTEIESLIGRECPFKMGQIIKFPDCGLSTLRLSDVSLTRLLNVLQLTHSIRVIVTIHKMMKLIQQIEESKGYPYQVDKKSMMKVLIALERQQLIRVYNKEVGEEKITIVTHRDIIDPDGPEVVEGIKATVEEYNREARIFPHGQYRLGTKVLKAAGLKEEAEKEEEELLDDLEAHLKEGGSMGIKDRYEMFRVQANRLANIESSRKESAKKRGKESESEESEEEEEEKSERWRDEEEEEEEDREEGMKVTKRSIDRGNQLGYQPKMIRYMIIHEVAFQLTRGNQRERPTLFDRFPPGRQVNEWKEMEYDHIPVMVDEESPLRFIPRCRYEGRQPGWFMVQDLLVSLPLSFFVLVCKPSGVIPKWKMMEYLDHPLRRHTLIGDLPRKLRDTLMYDKRVAKQVEHICIMLSHMGLMSIGENPTQHRFISSFTTMFFVGERGQLYDTSPSDKGFQYVTPPLSRYNRYDYSFEHVSDIFTYWHHMRAIVSSTRLSFRSEAEGEGGTAPGRAFSIGTVDKTAVSFPIEEAEETGDPIGTRDGCAGFSAKLCIHLSRHWEPNLRPPSVVNWFISRYRRHTDSMKGVIEERVERIEKQWSSFVRSLMPSDVELLRKKKATAKKEMVEPSISIRSGSALALEPKKQKRIDMGTPKSSAKKRPLDPVDILSEKNRMHVRSRFNSRERDMLILIRAVGFFLNPVYRFWLNPAVLRDIMHEYVPESRSKTVQSLMAAGVREMVRSHRLAYLQRIVRNLSTFPEMRSLRLELASNPLTTLEAKTDFFKNAFTVANRLLFSESQSMPGVSASDETFLKFLNLSKVEISIEPTVGIVTPARSKVPTSTESLSHCVATNVLMGTLIQSSIAGHNEKMLEQISANILHHSLHMFRSDGLVSRVRSNDPLSAKFNNKSNATLSYYFRTFFSHRFHPDIIDLTSQQLERIDSEEITNMTEDHVGVIMASLGAFYRKKELLLSVDDSILINFDSGMVESEQQQSVTKQIRYLEGANLELERIEVALGAGLDEEKGIIEEEVPSIQSIVGVMKRVFPLPSPIPSIDDVVDGLRSNEANNIRLVFQCLDEANFNGLSEKDIESKTGMDNTRLRRALDSMKDKSFIFEGGVDEKRWILMRHVLEWTIDVGGDRCVVRPWTLPDGSTCLSTLRWMTESVLVAILAQPAITIEALRFRFEFVLQPICVSELVSLLEEAKCVKKEERILKELKMEGPFDDVERRSVVRYILPTIDALERFARIFGSIPLISTAMDEY